MINSVSNHGLKHKLTFFVIVLWNEYSFTTSKIFTKRHSIGKPA